MLISNKVKIKINSSNFKYFSKYYNDLEKGEIKDIPIEYLSKSSHYLIDVCCDICFKHKKIEYRIYCKNISNGNYYACSPKCAKEKVIATNIERYGVDNPFKSNIIKDKIKQINIEKYGASNPSKSELIKNKIKQTFLEKYNVENISYLNETINKIKKTTLKRYGVDNVFKSDIIKNRIKQTNIEKYGFEYTINNKEIKDKIKKTNLERYGVEHISQDYNIHQKQLISGYKIKEYNNLLYQGTYEKDFIDLCISNMLEIKKPKYFIYEYKNKSRRYFPDFYLPKYNLIVEVKSTYYYNLHIERNELKKETVISDNYKYILILDKNYDEFIKIINN